MENNKDLGRWVEDRLASLESEAVLDTDAALACLYRRRDGRATRRLRCAWIVAATLATGIALMAFPAPRAFAQRCLDACSSESARIGQFFALRSRSGNVARLRPSDRRSAPDFTGTGADGNTVTLSELKGKVVLLNFWATWCAPCRVEIPWFTEFQRTYRDRGLVIVGVSFDDDGWKSVKPYLADAKINYPVVIGNEEIDKAFGGVAVLPETLVIDRNGRIASIRTGLVSKAAYEAAIESALSEH
jgi:cytochrome c biogenesis protein CcmG/thiol:disulfide interchange protein DsbE